MAVLIREQWSQGDYDEFFSYICSLSDAKYREFSMKLIPGTADILGIRVPMLRDIAKQIGKGDVDSFIRCKKGTCHEEIIIEGLVMAGIKCGYDAMLDMMKEFSHKIYNWAISDTVVFKGMKKYSDKYINDVDWFVFNDNEWIQRYGFGGLMNFCLSDEYIDIVFEKVNSVCSEHYYVQMMQAWLVATAMAKLRDRTVEFLKNNELNDETMNMAVRKICESRRISNEDKQLARSLIRKR